MRDGVHRGGMPARAPIKLTEYGAHAIGSSKRYGAALQGSPSKTVSPRGKDVHSNTVYNSRRAIAAASAVRAQARRTVPGLLRPVCGSAAAGSAFLFQGRLPQIPAGSRETGGKEGSFFRRRLSDTPSWPPFASATSVWRLGRRLLQGKNLLCIGVVQILQRIILVLQNFGAAVGEGLLQLHLVCHFCCSAAESWLL